MFQLPEGSLISFDTECTGLSWRKGDRPYCISFCNEKGQTAIVSFPVNPMTREVQYREDDLNVIRAWAADESIMKVAHNAQYDVGMLKGIGIEIKGQIICTMSLIRLMRSDAKLALKPFCKEYLGFPDDDERDLKDATRRARADGKRKGYKVFEGKSDEGSLAPDYWLAGADYFEKYCVLDSIRAMAVYREFIPGIKDTGVEKLWQTELETWKVLRTVEDRGICVNRNAVERNKEEIKKKLETYVAEAEKSVRSLYTYSFKVNLRSSKQLVDIFYNKLKEPVTSFTKNHNPSVDTMALKNMQNPLARKLLNIRACHKTIEFMDQYLEYMVQDGDQWFLHPNFSSSIPSTGRESCSSPNLQQVASGEDDKGLEVRVEARSVFVPRKGYRLRSYDWKNIEVYIPAFMSGEKKLINILKAKGDSHGITAANLTNRLGYTVSRYHAKRIFFGLQYGIGIGKLSRMLGISRNSAERIILGFKEEYPDLFTWMERLIWEGRDKGYIETAYGRRLHSDIETAYRFVNYYVQGTAGSILKNAKVKLHNTLPEGAHIVLPIHDEFLIEYRSGMDTSKLDILVAKAMQDNPELKMEVKIPVTVSSVGDNWSIKRKEKTIYDLGDIEYEQKDTKASIKRFLFSRRSEVGERHRKPVRYRLSFS